MDEFSPGHHLVAGTSTEIFLHDLTGRFLEQGLDAGELAFVLHPSEEPSAQGAFTWRGDELPTLVASGRVRVVPSENILARLDVSAGSRTAAVRQVLGYVLREALDRRHARARILNGVAPLFFERAEDEAAFEDPRRHAATLRIHWAHTHSLLEVPGGVVCDPPPSDAPPGASR